MKINEFNQPKKIDESLAGAMFGDVPMSALKGLFTGKGGKHQLAQDIFLKDFYQDALTSLDNGIKSGYVDPKLRLPDLSQNTQSGNAPPPGAGPATGAAGSAGTTTTGGTGSSATTPPTSPTPSDAAERGRQARADDDARWTKREEEHLKALGLKIGDTVTAKVDGKTITGTVDGSGNYEDEFSFTPSGRFARFMGNDYSRIATVDDIISKAGTPTRESAYSKLNQIFESIVSEMEDSGVSSIADYMLEWFGLYMEGVNWEARKSVVLPIINDIQSTYKTDQGKAAIEKLARMAFALSGPAKAVPAGAKDAAKDITGGTGTKATGKLTPEQLAAELAALKPIDRDKIIQTVTKAAS